MNPSRIFILRPVATTLLMVAILLAGAVAYKLLPVSALPQVDYPTIQVVTFYPGASPDVSASSITAPLERQFGQMPGLRQMTSTSSGGSSVVTLQFSLDHIKTDSPGLIYGEHKIATLCSRDIACDRQPQSGSAWLGRKKRLEDSAHQEEGVSV